jgi:hypothetical protein
MVYLKAGFIEIFEFFSLGNNELQVSLTFAEVGEF